MSEEGAEKQAVVWILVDHSSREEAFESVAALLEGEGVQTHVVTTTEVLGSVARDALAGSAERLLRGLRVAFRGRTGDEDLIGAAKRARPDVLVVTAAQYVRALGLLDSLAGTTALQVGVFSDFDFDQAWLRSSVHAFVVPHEDHRSRFGAQGFPTDRVLVGGPPIQKRFARELDRGKERGALRFGDDDTVVLVRADTLPPEQAEKLVFQCTLVDRPGLRFVFHHNGDGAVATALRRAASQYGLKAAMFGKVDDLERYVLAADAVVASPSDPFVPEVLALDRPLMFVGSEQQPAGQAEFLAKVGAAKYLDDVHRLGSELERFLEPESLKAVSEKAAELSKNTGAAEVTEAILTAIERRGDWLAEPSFEPAPDAAPEGDAEPDDSPFETIGADPAAPAGGDNSGDGPQRSYSGISRAAAKEQLAALILNERDIERRLAENEKQQERWRSRFEMARDWKEDDLAAEAKAVLRGYIDEADELERERVAVVRQKTKLKAAAADRASTSDGDEEGAGPNPDMERRFRKMEVESDLDDLKDRIRREMGD